MTENEEKFTTIKPAATARLRQRRKIGINSATNTGYYRSISTLRTKNRQLAKALAQEKAARANDRAFFQNKVYEVTCAKASSSLIDDEVNVKVDRLVALKMRKISSVLSSMVASESETRNLLCEAMSQCMPDDAVQKHKASMFEFQRNEKETFAQDSRALGVRGNPAAAVNDAGYCASLEDLNRCKTAAASLVTADVHPYNGPGNEELSPSARQEIRRTCERLISATLMDVVKSSCGKAATTEPRSGPASSRPQVTVSGILYPAPTVPNNIIDEQSLVSANPTGLNPTDHSRSSEGRFTDDVNGTVLEQLDMDLTSMRNGAIVCCEEISACMDENVSHVSPDTTLMNTIVPASASVSEEQDTNADRNFLRFVTTRRQSRTAVVNAEVEQMSEITSEFPSLQLLIRINEQTAAASNGDKPSGAPTDEVKRATTKDRRGCRSKRPKKGMVVEVQGQQQGQDVSQSATVAAGSVAVESLSNGDCKVSRCTRSRKTPTDDGTESTTACRHETVAVSLSDVGMKVKRKSMKDRKTSRSKRPPKDGACEAIITDNNEVDALNEPLHLSATADQVEPTTDRKASSRSKRTHKDIVTNAVATDQREIEAKSSSEVRIGGESTLLPATVIQTKNRSTKDRKASSRSKRTKNDAATDSTATDHQGIQATHLPSESSKQVGIVNEHVLLPTNTATVQTEKTSIKDRKVSTRSKRAKQDATTADTEASESSEENRRVERAATKMSQSKRMQKGSDTEVMATGTQQTDDENMGKKTQSRSKSRKAETTSDVQDIKAAERKCPAIPSTEDKISSGIDIMTVPLVDLNVNCVAATMTVRDSTVTSCQMDSESSRVSADVLTESNRRRTKYINYKEPALSRKLRQGDHFTSTIYQK